MKNAVFFFKELYFNAILSFSIRPTVVRQPTSLAPTDRPWHLFKSKCEWLCLAIRRSYTHHLNEEGLFHMLACVIHVLAKLTYLSTTIYYIYFSFNSNPLTLNYFILIYIFFDFIKSSINHVPKFSINTARNPYLGN